MPRKTRNKSAEAPLDEISATTANPDQSLADAIEYGYDVLLVGPCGCGKTTVAENVAKSLGLPVETFHLGGVFDGEAFLQGRTELEMGQTVFRPSRFSDAIQRPRTVVILDELNRAPYEVNNAMLSLTDHQRRMSLDIADAKDRVIERARDVVFVATANIGAEYVGTQTLDPALEDRLIRIQMDYPPVEPELLVELGLSSDRAEVLMKTATAIREAHARGSIGCSLSTRSLLRTGEMVARGMGLEQALLFNVQLFTNDAVAAFIATVRSAQ